LPIKTEDDDLLISHLGVFLSFISAEYKFTLSELEDMERNHEISYDYFWALYKPERLYVTTSNVTGALIVVRLLSTWIGQALTCETLDSSDNGLIWKTEQIPAPISVFGRVPTTSLHLYPLEHHPDVDNFKETLIKRGKKWRDLNGIHLKEYNGSAYTDDKSKSVMVSSHMTTSLPM
jgi:hypothetical protein